MIYKFRIVWRYWCVELSVVARVRVSSRILVRFRGRFDFAMVNVVEWTIALPDLRVVRNSAHNAAETGITGHSEVTFHKLKYIEEWQLHSPFYYLYSIIRTRIIFQNFPCNLQLFMLSSYWSSTLSFACLIFLVFGISISGNEFVSSTWNHLFNFR